MTFDDLLAQICDLLQRQGRVSYWALQRRFDLSDNDLEGLKVELIEVQELAMDRDGKMLVWTGDARTTPAPAAPSPPLAPPSDIPTADGLQVKTLPTAPPPADAERRQLTVLFCDLVDSTVLASQLDPEELREVVRAYQEACAQVIARFEGHIAQYLGDGLLVYFGYPLAHEDDAQRAVRAGLGMLEAMRTLNIRLSQEKGLRLTVRLGIHTGLVVVGEMGSGGHSEPLALGDTPNIASRLQGLATPDTMLISEATYRLVQGYFTLEALAPQTLKGVAVPMPVYRVLGESGVRSRLEVVTGHGLSALVGRESEVALLLERWTQSTDGQGQAVVLRGEAGIGKSRLVEVLRAQVERQGGTRITWRCSPYHTNSPLYPVIEYLQRRLHWDRDDTPQAKVDKLEQAFRTHRLALEDVVPLFAALLSVPLPDRYPLLSLTPQKQRQQTLAALVAWLLGEAERQPVLAVCEDLHWADPTTLDLLGLLLDQAPTARMLILLTCRPEFQPPWTGRAPLTQLTLGRLSRPQVAQMVGQLTGGKAFPAEVLEQVIARTDGVPLFVEELLKMLLESGLVYEGEGLYVLSGALPVLAIPATLQDSLVARLDRLAGVKTLAQLGAVLGREFPYEIIRVVAAMDESTVQQGLAQLVDAELLYQRGQLPQATFRFKHALIQEAAYQSLLKSTRQQHHQRIAQVLEAHFPEIVETQPELLASHYTAAGLAGPAISYLQQAGARAIERSANVEAISHLTTALALLQTLSDTPERVQHELDVSIALGIPLVLTRGHAAPEVEATYARARELCQQLGDTPQLFPALLGLRRFYFMRGALQTAHDLGEQLLRLAERLDDRGLRVRAHHMLAEGLLYLGEFAQARAHAEQGIKLYDPQQHRAQVFHYGNDSGVGCRVFVAQTLWVLGYPDQALRRMDEALTWAQELAHPFNLTFALGLAAAFHQFRREPHRAQELAEAGIALAREHGFMQFLAMASMRRGGALAEQGQVAEGLAQMRQGMADWGATGAQIRPFALMLLADAYGHMGQPEEGLRMLAEAEAAAQARGERFMEAELSRLKGELLLAQSAEHHTAAETCFQQALAAARYQQAKSWELRAAMSLSRLWQQHGKSAAAGELLTPIYGWFTEGFDTADLQEARALIEELAFSVR